MQLSMADLVSFLKANKLKRIYLIHEVHREKEAREFGQQLSEKGFEPMIAADYRKNGKIGVSRAIAISQFSLVLAFDDETITTCERMNIPYISLEEEWNEK